MKIIESDPQFDKKRAQKKLRNFVEGNEYTIKRKAAIMIKHFHEQVIAKGKIGGQTRAMVVTASIPRYIKYYYVITKLLAKRHSPFKAIITFSCEHKHNGQEPALTSAAMNGFPDSKIPSTFKKDPYRLLIVADMFQTGFDEPLLHTMYVDKMLYDIKAVQTLSRLNRCHPKKRDTFVLDFYNKPEDIQTAFSTYYKTTILSGETDPNKLYNLIATMEEYQVFSTEEVEHLVDLFLDGSGRERLDPLLDANADIYKDFETEDQIKFKSAAKAFVHTYGFLGAILPYGNADWEKLSIFPNLLIPKLPSPRDDDLSEGFLESIDLNNYRPEARDSLSIVLEDSDTEVAPVPTGKGGHIIDPEMDLLSNIVSEFNDMFGNIEWKDEDNARHQVTEVIPAMVSKDESYPNAMRNSNVPYPEQREICRFLTSNGFSLTELMDFSDAAYRNVTEYWRSHLRTSVFINILDRCRTLIKGSHAGQNILRYLLFNMNNEIIKDQRNVSANYKLSDLYILNGSIPFNTMAVA